VRQHQGRRRSNHEQPKFPICTVDTDGAEESAVLPYCASGPSNFFMLTQPSRISTAFQRIGTQTAELRVTNRAADTKKARPPRPGFYLSSMAARLI
jgi:hypothetical protein